MRHDGICGTLGAIDRQKRENQNVGLSVTAIDVRCPY